MNIQVFSVDGLSEALKTGTAVHSHCVSIGDPGEPEIAHLDSIFSDTLRLEFHDVSFDSHRLEETRMPERSDILRLYDFYHSTADVADGYTIHCHAGISRSTATALIYFYLSSGSEAEAAEALLSMSDFCLPNKIMIELFDKEYGSNLNKYNYQIWKRFFPSMTGIPVGEVWEYKD